MVAESKKYIVGQLVVCNPEHPKIKADRMDEGWTTQYHKFLKGHTAHIVERISIGDLSYKLQIDGDTFYTEDESEMMLWTPEMEIKPDAVNHPKHYAVFEQLEAIEVIASSMTTEQFYGYCLGNILKYRLRAGGKDDVMQELGKADRYQGLYNEFKHLCKGA